MTKEKQVQKAGDNSNQVQTQTMIVNNYFGLSEDRAKELFGELSSKMIEDALCAGFEVATQRIQKFQDEVIPRLKGLEEKFQSFNDPAFQVFIKKAQLSAATSDREIDIELLSELVAHRVNNKKDIKKKTSIEKAVEIINKIDYDALCGLTMFYSMCKFVPVSGSIEKGIQDLNDLYEKCQYEELPKDDEWLDNLDILNVVRKSFNSFEKFEDYLIEKFDGYVCVGIKVDSAEYVEFCNELKRLDLEFILVNHELLDGYARLLMPFKDSIDKYIIENVVDGREIESEIVFSDEQKRCLKTIQGAYSKDVVLLNKVKEAFKNKLNSQNAIKKAIDWWNGLDNYFEVTSVGSVVAHVNAKRIDDNIPDLDE